MKKWFEMGGHPQTHRNKRNYVSIRGNAGRLKNRSKRAGLMKPRKILNPLSNHVALLPPNHVPNRAGPTDGGPVSLAAWRLEILRVLVALVAVYRFHLKKPFQMGRQREGQ